MSNITIEMEKVEVSLKKEQIKEILNQLKPKEVISIIKEYQRKNWIKELDILTQELSRTAKANRVTEEDIDEMVEEVRNTRNEKTVHRSN